LAGLRGPTEVSFTIAGVPVEIRNQYSPNPTRDLYLLGLIMHGEKLQLLPEIRRNLRITDVPSEFKSDFVSLKLMNPYSPAK
jgi:hypothetical protein